MSQLMDTPSSGCSDCEDRDQAGNYEAFDQALPELLRTSEGKYALVGLGKVLEVAETFTAACHAGYESGLGKDFLVLKIAEHQGIRTALILT